MASVIEETVKALVEFESQLDRVKAESADAKKKMVKDATDWSESSRSAAISKAQELASSRLAKAREEADADAAQIKKKGEGSLKSFEASLSKHKSKASEVVAARLLGESP